MLRRIALTACQLEAVLLSLFNVILAIFIKARLMVFSTHVHAISECSHTHIHIYIYVYVSILIHACRMYAE